MRPLRILVPTLVGWALAASPGAAEPKPELRPLGRATDAAAAARPEAVARGFDQRLELQGVAFSVSCPNESSINDVRIAVAGLELDTAPIVREAEGVVVGAEVADLDANGDPEIYVYVQSAGSGSYGSLIAYAVNAGKSLTEIYLPPLEDDAKTSAGYMGHDEFTVGEGRLLRRFPVYREGDPNAAPRGGIRQLQYRLVAGEAGWILALDGSSDYPVANAARPSFDCGRAAGAVEELVCSDEALAALDRRLAEIWEAALSRWPQEEIEAQRAAQRAWIHERNECAKADDARACADLAYRTRTTTIQIQSGQLEVATPVLYVCSEDPAKPFYVAYNEATDPTAAVVTYDNRQEIVLHVPSGSGARYAGPNIDFWEHHGEARVEFFGRTLTCKERGKR